MNTFIYFIYFIYGCIIGSFLNVCIYRIPAGISFSKGRSYCPVCKETLKPYDMVPLLSYMILGGKCRNCKTRISIQYPLIELLTGIAFTLTAIRYHLSLHSILVCLFICGLIVDACIDFHTMELPDRIAVFIFLLGLVRFIAVPADRISLLIGAVIISIPMFIVALITNGFGGGDIKLCAAAGFFLGFKAILLGSFIGCIVGAVYALFLVLKKHGGRKTLFPFGPFLCIGFFIAALYCEPILEFYFSSIVLIP